MFINILLKIHFEVDKQLSIMYYMLSLKETFLRRSINEYCYHSFLCRNYWCNDVFHGNQATEEGTEASAGTYEFGNNKNCRISMQKKAIAQVEKPSDSTSAE